MTKLLISKNNPDGYSLEDVLRMIRQDILVRCVDLEKDKNPEVEEVLSNNMYILGLMEQIISYAEGSSAVMERIYGKSQG